MSDEVASAGAVQRRALQNTFQEQSVLPFPFPSLSPASPRSLLSESLFLNSAKGLHMGALLAPQRVWADRQSPAAKLDLVYYIKPRLNLNIFGPLVAK